MTGPGLASRVLTVSGDDGDREFVVTALDPLAYSALVDAHPPRAGNPPGLPWDQESFPPALIAACAGIDLAEAQDWWDDWPTDAAEDTLELCLELCSPGSIDWAIRRVDGDDRLALELAYCGPAGLPHSTFLSWDRRDRDLALGWLARRLDRCPGCGVPTADMDDPLAADVALRSCVHCDAKSRLLATVPDDARDRIHVVVSPTRGREADDESEAV